MDIGTVTLSQTNIFTTPYIQFLFTVLFAYDQSGLKKISLCVCETLSKVFEEHEVPNKL